MAPALPTPSASIILVRDAPPGPQLFMVRRHPRNKFWANALVFVGGCVDPVDRTPAMRGCSAGLSPGEAARRLGLDEEQALAIHAAALRECFEEAGVLLVDEQRGSIAAGAREPMRGELLSGAVDLPTALGRRGLMLDLGALHCWDHWITPEFEQRRFDTHFFVSPAPEDQAATHDPVEASAGAWFTAEQALAGQRRGEHSLAPPTLAILHRLRAFRAAGDILAACARGPIPAVQPRPLIGHGGEAMLLFPGDHRFSNPDSEGGAEDFVSLRDGRWEYFRTRS